LVIKDSAWHVSGVRSGKVAVRELGMHKNMGNWKMDGEECGRNDRQEQHGNYERELQ